MSHTAVSILISFLAKPGDLPANSAFLETYSKLLTDSWQSFSEGILDCTSVKTSSWDTRLQNYSQSVQFTSVSRYTIVPHRRGESHHFSAACGAYAVCSQGASHTHCSQPSASSFGQVWTAQPYPGTLEGGRQDRSARHLPEWALSLHTEIIYLLKRTGLTWAKHSIKSSLRPTVGKTVAPHRGG